MQHVHRCATLHAPECAIIAAMGACVSWLQGPDAMRYIEPVCILLYVFPPSCAPLAYIHQNSRLRDPYTCPSDHQATRPITSLPSNNMSAAKLLDFPNKEGVLEHCSTTGRTYVSMTFAQTDKELGSVIVELYTDIAPRTCENFLALIRGTAPGGFKYKVRGACWVLETRVCA